MMTSARDIIRQITPDNQSYHVAQSTEISHAAICGYKFKLPKVMGAVPEQEDGPKFWVNNILCC
jgi:hypothetical protein